MGQQFCLTLDEFTACYTDRYMSIKYPPSSLKNRCSIDVTNNKTEKNSNSKDNEVDINNENNATNADMSKGKRLPFVFALLSDFYRNYYNTEPNKNNCISFIRDEGSNLRSNHIRLNTNCKSNGFDESDSNPSEDNLSEDEVMKLLSKSKGNNERHQNTKTKKKRKKKKKKKGSVLSGVTSKKKSCKSTKLPLRDNNGVSKAAGAKCEGEDSIGKKKKKSASVATFPSLLNKAKKPSSSHRRNRAKTICPSYWMVGPENKVPNRDESSSPKTFSIVNLSLAGK